MIIYRALMGVFCLVGSTMTAAATCSGFSNPAASAGLESIKALISQGRFTDAFVEFEVPHEAKRRLAEGLEPIVADDTMGCITIKRSRQNPRFIPVVCKTEGPQTVLYWTISGEVDGLTIRMINFSYSDDFNEIRGLIY